MESFHTRLRAELLDRELFFDMEEVQLMVDDWRDIYNHRPPHGALGYLPPVRPQQEAALRASAPLPAEQNAPFPLNTQLIAAD